LKRGPREKNKTRGEGDMLKFRQIIRKWEFSKSNVRYDGEKKCKNTGERWRAVEHQ